MKTRADDRRIVRCNRSWTCHENRLREQANRREAMKKFHVEGETFARSTRLRRRHFFTQSIRAALAVVQRGEHPSLPSPFWALPNQYKHDTPSRRSRQSKRFHSGSRDQHSPGSPPLYYDNHKASVPYHPKNLAESLHMDRTSAAGPRPSHVREPIRPLRFHAIPFHAYMQAISRCRDHVGNGSKRSKINQRCPYCCDALQSRLFERAVRPCVCILTARHQPVSTSAAGEEAREGSLHGQCVLLMGGIRSCLFECNAREIALLRMPRS